MIAAPTSTRQQNNKGEEVKGRWLLFCGGSLFYVFVRFIKLSYHQDSNHYLQINSIEIFYYK
jgi:hypothetical protein